MSQVEAVSNGRQKIRVRMRPDQEIEVSDREARALRRQGLIIGDKPKTPASDGKPGDGPTPPAAAKPGDNKAGGPGKEGS